jgi:hypothetical protein
MNLDASSKAWVVASKAPTPYGSSQKADIPIERRKDITCGQFVCTVRPE